MRKALKLLPHQYQLMQGRIMVKIPQLEAYATYDGQVYSPRLGRFIAMNNDKDGYKLCKVDGKTYRAHRLIASAYLGESKLLVNHKDGVKYNNHRDNLEWATHSENVRHAMDNGLMTMEKQQEANERRKLFADDDIIHIRNTYGVSENYNSLAKRYNVSRGVIYQIVKKSTYKEVSPK